MSKAAEQQQRNKAISDFLKSKESDNKPFSLPEIDYIQGYTGEGGLISQGASSRGVLYEYYTPYKIVEAMWALAYRHGFNSGNILEPSCGIGRFLKYVDPTLCTVDAFEFSKDNTTSYLIAKNSYQWASITNNYFESIFYEGNTRKKSIKPVYDLVIGNPPYGKFTGYYSGPKREGKYFKGSTYDQYFIWAGLKLLKQGGLLVFIVPSSFLSGGSNAEFRDELSDMAELVDAYRLPVGVFDTTDIMTDIIVLKKK